MSHLQELDLRGNEIGPAGAEKIAAAFDNVPKEYTALALILMTIDNCENVFFRPSFIDSLSENEFSYLSEFIPLRFFDPM